MPHPLSWEAAFRLLLQLPLFGACSILFVNSRLFKVRELFLEFEAFLKSLESAPSFSVFHELSDHRSELRGGLGVGSHVLLILRILQVRAVLVEVLDGSLLVGSEPLRGEDDSVDRLLLPGSGAVAQTLESLNGSADNVDVVFHAIELVGVAFPRDIGAAWICRPGEDKTATSRVKSK